MTTVSRFVEYVFCPNCGKRGVLYASYNTTQKGFSGPYFAVRHLTCEKRNAELYHELRLRGFSGGNAQAKARRRNKFAGQCYFGKTYPGVITRPIRLPDDRHVGCPRKERPDNPVRYFGDMKGEDNPNVKLSITQVRAIRRAYVRGLVSQSDIGKEYGIAQTTVSQIVRGVIWREA